MSKISVSGPQDQYLLVVKVMVDEAESRLELALLGLALETELPLVEGLGNGNGGFRKLP